MEAKCEKNEKNPIQDGDTVSKSNNQRIVFVSRLDPDCSIGAHLICEIAPRIYEKYKNAQIFIIGGGTEYNEILKKANKINTLINHKLIFAIGSSDDPSAYFTKNTLFVGVARSALEAMSRGIPVILLGNEGYLGLFERKKLSAALKSNLTCRNSAHQVSKESLFCEICRYFNATKEEKAALSSLSLEVVNKYFSIEKSANRTLAFYHEIINGHNATKKRSNNTIACYKNNNISTNLLDRKSADAVQKIAICGYYGRGNFGDEAILREITRKIKNVSAEAQNTVKIELIRSEAPHKIITALYNADIFIFGGGSLLQNSTSDRSLVYYLGIIFLADTLCKTKIMLSNGIGPIAERKIPKSILLHALKKAISTFDAISVRDEASKKMLEGLMPGKRIDLIHDPAALCFINGENNNRGLIFGCGADREGALLQERSGESEGDNKDEIIGESKKRGRERLIFIPCARMHEREELYEDDVGSALTQIAANIGCNEIIIALLNRDDEAMSLRISKKANICRITRISSSQELITLLSGTRLCITERYHGALFSLFCKAPTLAISRDPKMNSLCRELGAIEPFSPSILTRSNTLCESCKRVLEFGTEQREKVSQKIVERAIRTDAALDKLFTHFVRR